MALQLAFDVVGSGPPLLVLHGLFGSASNWRTVAKALAVGHQVFSLDLRNHGRSPWSDTMDYLAMADDLARFVADQGLGPVALLGHSMGGKAAMALALTQPERVERLIVVDIAPLPYADTLTPFALAMRGIDLGSAASRSEVQRQLEARLPEPAVAPFLLQNLVARDGHFDWRINLAAIVSSMAALADFPAALRERHYTGPVTAIAGALSAYVPRQAAAAFAPMFDNVAVDFIDGAGHWVHADRPQAFVAAAQRALA